MRDYEEYKARVPCSHRSEPFEQIGIPDNIGIAEWSFTMDEYDYSRFFKYLDQIAYRYECDYVLVMRDAYKPVRFRHFSESIDDIRAAGYLKTSNSSNLSFGRGIYCYYADCAENMIPSTVPYVDFDYSGIYLECIYDGDPHSDLPKDDYRCPEIFIPSLILPLEKPSYSTKRI